MQKINKTVLITGGAKRIGASIAEILVKNNFNVIIHFNKSENEAIKLCKRLNQNKKVADIIQGDLMIEKDVKKIFSNAYKIFSPITGLINNASTFKYDNLKTMTDKSWHYHINPNLKAPIYLSKYFVKFLPKNTKGDIINVIDQRVLNLTPHFFSYTISKSALWTITKTMALDLAPNIKVNAIGPGPTLKSKFQSDKEFKRQCKSMPLQTGAQPIEISQAVLFLLSIKSMTGQLLVLDGGQHLGWGQVSNKKDFKD